MKVEEKNQTARERQEGGDEEDDIDKELEVRATHDPYSRSLRWEPGCLADEPRSLSDEPGGRSNQGRGTATVGAPWRARSRGIG
jgi:hypothetical protein